MKDTARVLGRMYNAIEYRGYSQEVVEELARYAGVPVFNGLTDEYHPTQMLADVLTMREHSDKPLTDISYTYLGDARNNMGNSLLLIGAKLGMDVRIGAPKSLWPTDEHVATCHKFAEESGARLTLTEDAKAAVKGTDFVHTDVWVSMGEPVEAWGERIGVLMPYQVNMDLMKATGNPRAKFMHCLPAFHNSETEVGKKIAAQYPALANGIEVTEEVFESPLNIAFEQAENRMHTIKAILVSTLADL
jgi:ornithine carbamoyltransferase